MWACLNNIDFCSHVCCGQLFYMMLRVRDSSKALQWIEMIYLRSFIEECPVLCGLCVLQLHRAFLVPPMILIYKIYIHIYTLYIYIYILLVTARDPLAFLRWWAIRWLIPQLLGLSATCGRNVILVTMFFVLSAAWKLMKLISYGSNKWSDNFMIMVTCVLDTLRMLNTSINNWSQQ